jgi:penicillin-binding protein 1A
MRFLMRLASIGLLLGIVALVGVWVILSKYSKDLPDYTVLKDYRPPILSRVYAGDGRLLSTIASEQRVFVPIEVVPKRVIDAFISAEDKDFYVHHGIDFQGIIGAIPSNISKVMHSHRPAGRSTITQQVVKNMLTGDEMSFGRKIREAMLAIRVEQAMTKDRIIELYLNQIYLGFHSYGIAAAAMNYFNKSLDELSIADCAFLASLPKGPNDYHPIRRHDAAITRRNWVIGRMLDDGRITKDEAQMAQAEPLEVKKRDSEEFVTADYFAEEVRRQLIDRFGDKNVLEGGLMVRTSLDPAMQDYATNALKQGLQDFDRRQRGYRGVVAHLPNLENWSKQLLAVPAVPGAEDWRQAVVLSLKNDKAEIGFADGKTATMPWDEMKWARRENEDSSFGPAVKRPADVVKVGDVVLAELLDEKKNSYALRQVPKVQGAIAVMNPHTGRIYAMTGGFSAKISQFDRVTQANRQPGSSFKPFVYLAALDKGFTPSSLVLDGPFSYRQGPGMPLWQPENYSQQFYGPTPLRVGLEKSRNVMTVRLANSIGMPAVVDVAKKFGIADEMPTLLSFALGAKETTLLRMTAAYAMLDNGGKKITPTVIDRVQDRDGHTVWRRDATACAACQTGNQTDGFVPPEIPDNREQIDDPRTVYQVVSMMQGVCQRGTAARLNALGKPVAGKTGTTNDSKDVWFIGFSPDLVAGVFVGYDDPEPLGSHETGASIAVPIFQDFMEHALKDRPATPFRVPSGMRQVRVDAATGNLADENTKTPIWEAFIPGTEPTGQPLPVLDGSAGEVVTTPDPNAPVVGIDGVVQPATVTTYPSPYHYGAMPPNSQNGAPIQPVTTTPATNPPVTTGTGGLY